MAATSTLTIRKDCVLKQAVVYKTCLCSIDSASMENPEKTYPAGFFDLFGTDVDTGIQEPHDMLVTHNTREFSRI